MQRAVADVAETTGRTFLQRLRFVLPLALGGALAWDWYTHESPEYIKRQMASHLRKCRVPEAARGLPVSTLVLPVSQYPLTLGFLPTMVLAPSGAGKSTLLAKAAREAAMPADAARAPAPAVLVRIRHTPTSAGAAVEMSSDLSAYAQLDATAQLVYSQIGFPVRRALLKLVLDGVEITMKGGMSYKLKADTVTSRLSTALSTLFEVSATLCHERVAAGLSREEAAPVLLFDEVQDLIRDDRLANAGGLAVFLALSKLLVMYGVDQRVVRTAVTGSSALLSVFFERTVARGGRWSFYELRDPDEGPVLAALCAGGYSPCDAADMVALCGTRLRLLEEPLAVGAAVLGAREFIAAAHTSAVAHFEDVLSAGSVADAAGALLHWMRSCSLRRERAASSPAWAASSQRSTPRLQARCCTCAATARWRSSRACTRRCGDARAPGCGKCRCADACERMNNEALHGLCGQF